MCVVKRVRGQMCVGSNVCGIERDRDRSCAKIAELLRQDVQSLARGNVPRSASADE